MTTSRTVDYFIRNEREAAIAARSDRLALQFAERAAKHDAEGSFPFDNFEDLRREGYLNLTVPKRFGGEEASLYELVIAQERLARGDGSTALAVGWHIGQLFHYRYARRWPEAAFARLCEDVVANGTITNHLASERATGSPSRGGKPETTAVRTAGGWLISGRKTYSTLSPILEQFTLSASIDGEDAVGEFFVRKGPGSRVEETWDTVGMRATGSHDVVLDQVFVPDDGLLSRSGPGIEPQGQDDGGGWMLHIPACYIGIASAARDYAIDFAREYKPNSLSAPIAELPHIQRSIGLIESELITIRTLIYSVADRWDREDAAGRIALKPELGLVKYTATNQALAIVDKAMRIVGGASLARSLPLERWYRDVRAGLHNPPMDDSVLNNLARRALSEGQ